MNTLTALDEGEFVSVIVNGDREGPRFIINKTCKEWGSAPKDSYQAWEKLCNKAGLDVKSAHLTLTDAVRAVGIEI